VDAGSPPSFTLLVGLYTLHDSLLDHLDARRALLAGGSLSDVRNEDWHWFCGLDGAFDLVKLLWWEGTEDDKGWVCPPLTFGIATDARRGGDRFAL